MGGTDARRNGHIGGMESAPFLHIFPSTTDPGTGAMQPQNFTIDETGEILEHPTDFDAVGRRIRELVTDATWPWVERSISLTIATRETQRCVCEVETDLAIVGVLLRMHPIGDGWLRVTASEVAQVPMDLVLEMMYRVVLIDPSKREPATVEYETPDRDLAVDWVRGWLAGDLGLAPAIIPPKRSKRPV